MAESQKNQTEKENIVELKTNIYLLSIIGEVEGCNGVLYDITTKPPASIEWE